MVASYQGVELIGITAGEAKNPQVTLRSAVGKVLWRILIFYVGAIFVIVTIFPWNEIGSNGSPFVLTLPNRYYRSGGHYQLCGADGCALWL